MYVLRRTVGTAITVRASDVRIGLRLVDIDFLGACAVVKVTRDDIEVEPLELGPGEEVSLHPDVRLKLLRLSFATHEGTPARTAEFGFDAPRSIPIRRAELDN